MLLVKEIKDSHVLWTIIGGIVLLFAAFTWMFYSDVITLFGFNEILVSTVAAIYCSHILYNFTDLELLTAAPRSLFTIIFTKYIAFVGCILVLGGIQVLLSLLLFPKAAFVILMSLIPLSLFLSSAVMLLSILFKNSNTGLVIILVNVLIMLNVGDGLAKHILPRYYYEFIDWYDTVYMYRSSLWIVNRGILFGSSLLIWLVIYLVLRKRKWDLL